MVAQARTRHRRLSTGSSCRCSARVVRIGLLVLGAGLLFEIHDADETDRLLRQWPRPAGRPAALGPGDAVPGAVGLHAVLAAPDVSRRRVLEISRHPPFLRGSRLDLGGALPSRQSVPRHHRRRCRAADGRHLAQRDAVGRALQHLPFGVRPRQSELDAGPVQIRARHPGVPSLASHRTANRAATPISPAPSRSGTSCSAPSNAGRDKLPANYGAADPTMPAKFLRPARPPPAEQALDPPNSRRSQFLHQSSEQQFGVTGAARSVSRLGGPVSRPGMRMSALLSRSLLRAFSPALAAGSLAAGAIAALILV